MAKIRLERNYLLKGFKYAGMFMIISGIMGFLYGLIAGVVVQPMLFAIVVSGVAVMINFAISVLVWIFRFIFYTFGKQSEQMNRYLLYSLAFALAYFPFFVILKWVNISIF